MLFLCVNCVGFYHLWTIEHNLRISNLKREEFSQIRSKKDVRKQQQVGAFPPVERDGSCSQKCCDSNH